MGIVNVTPDSFSDGGRFAAPDDALHQIEAMLKAGADIIDVGGESTRPGGEPVDADEELRRVLPVVAGIARRFGCPISIDTTKHEVARAALDAGASIVNDVLGLQSGGPMAQTVAEADAGVVIMHNARLCREACRNGRQDIISAMTAFLHNSLTVAFQAGLAPDQIILDPGIGFGVTTAESLAMIRRLPELQTFELPILVGPSRKRFIGEILQAPVDERLMGTATAVAVAIARGADFVRIHDVQELAPVVRMADAICRSWREEST
jgi:dihydropteroate synthase